MGDFPSSADRHRRFFGSRWLQIDVRRLLTVPASASGPQMGVPTDPVLPPAPGPPIWDKCRTTNRRRRRQTTRHYRASIKRCPKQRRSRPTYPAQPRPGWHKRLAHVVDRLQRRVRVTASDGGRARGQHRASQPPSIHRGHVARRPDCRANPCLSRAEPRGRRQSKKEFGSSCVNYGKMVSERSRAEARRLWMVLVFGFGLARSVISPPSNVVMGFAP